MKKGFTLAEVLLTLGIIGIVAAITLPSLNTNINDKVAVASLKKAFNTLQTASDMVMAEDVTATTFSAACGFTDYDRGMDGRLPLRCLAKKIRGRVENLSESSDITISNDSRKVSKDATVVTTKDGSQITRFTTHAYYPGASDEDGPGEPAGTLYMDIYLVDINGFTKGPNTFGKDMFLLAMDLSNGEMYGFGSKDYYAAASGAGLSKEKIAAMSDKDADGKAKDPDYSSIPTWTHGNCDSTSVKFARTCAGSILDNGKVIYNMN